LARRDFAGLADHAQKKRRKITWKKIPKKSAHGQKKTYGTRRPPLASNNLGRNHKDRSLQYFGMPFFWGAKTIHIEKNCARDLKKKKKHTAHVISLLLRITLDAITKIGAFNILAHGVFGAGGSGCLAFVHV
jgi:hypothetical protein